jgi:hypothetical protein
MTEKTTLCIRKCTKTRFEQVRDNLASEIGEKPTHDETVARLVKEYFADTEETLFVSQTADRPATYHEDRNCAQVRAGLRLVPAFDDEIPSMATACPECAGGMSVQDALAGGLDD